MPLSTAPPNRFDGADAFGIYCTRHAHPRQRSHVPYGRCHNSAQGEADRACREILDAHIDLDVVGGEGSGCEFHSHEGLGSGYGRRLRPPVPVLLAIGQHQGWAPKSTPAYSAGEADLPHG